VAVGGDQYVVKFEVPSKAVEGNALHCSMQTINQMHAPVDDALRV
jgi:hypothetical protein